MRILFVCLGNICRSPTAEGVFRSVAEQEGVEVDIASAGTGGSFMLVPMAVLLIVALVLSLLAKRWKVQRTYQPSGPSSAAPAAVTPGIAGSSTH